MNRRKLIASSAVAALLTVGVVGVGTANPAQAKEVKFEKCYGVAKAGHNDCQTATSSCAGTSTTDGAKNVWIFVPAGTCAKIVGGSTSST